MCRCCRGRRQPLSFRRRYPVRLDRAVPLQEGRSRMQADDRQVSEGTASEQLDLRVGELVEVRSEQEILATLDEHGRLDGLPFMPEMLQFAGQRLRVDKRDQDLRHHRQHRHVSHGAGDAPGGGPLRRVGPRWLSGRLPSLLEGGLAQARGQGDAGAGHGRGPRGRQWIGAATAPMHHGHPSRADTDRAGRLQRAHLRLSGDRDAQGGPDASPGVRPRPVHAGRHVQERPAAPDAPVPARPSVQQVPVAQPCLLPRLLLIHGGASYPFIDGKVRGRTPKETLDSRRGSWSR